MERDRAIATYRKLYAALVRLYPASYRERFEEAMAQTFNDLCCERVATGRPLLGLFFSTAIETFVAVIRENVMSASPATSLIAKPSAWLPIALSLGCFAFLLTYAVLFGAGDQPPPGQRQDEGVAAHIFQLAMLAQALIVIFFAIRWLPRAPKRAALILALQIIVAAMPVALVWFFEHAAS